MNNDAIHQRNKKHPARLCGMQRGGDYGAEGGT